MHNSLKVSEETRKKMSDSAKRRAPMSEETKRKLSIANKGKTFSKETRKKISEANKGHKCNVGHVVSEQTRKKISEANKGKRRSEEFGRVMSRHNRERVVSEESKKKMSVAGKGRLFSEETRKKIGDAHRGKTMSKESKKKMSVAAKNRWKNPEFAKKMLKAFEMKPTKPEIQMEALLNELFPKEYKYVGDGDVWINGKNPDFINCNGQKKIVEVYGDYWHRDHKEQDRIDIFEPYGYQTLVIWASEIDDGTNYVRNELKKFHSLEH